LLGSFRALGNVARGIPEFMIKLIRSYTTLENGFEQFQNPWLCCWALQQPGGCCGGLTEPTATLLTEVGTKSDIRDQQYRTEPLISD
jgi:hypothetical protein